MSGGGRITVYVDSVVNPCRANTRSRRSRGPRELGLRVVTHAEVGDVRAWRMSTFPWPVLPQSVHDSLGIIFEATSSMGLAFGISFQYLIYFNAGLEGTTLLFIKLSRHHYANERPPDGPGTLPRALVGLHRGYKPRRSPGGESPCNERCGTERCEHDWPRTGKGACPFYT